MKKILEIAEYPATPSNLKMLKNGHRDNWSGNRCVILFLDSEVEGEEVDTLEEAEVVRGVVYEG